MSVSEQRAEPWIAMGYYYSANALRTSRAVYFAQKVTVIVDLNKKCVIMCIISTCSSIIIIISKA